MRARRRLKLILISLLTVSIVLFLESRIESFAPQVREFAGLKVEDAFGKNFKFFIGGLEGGVFRPLTLSDCAVMDKYGAKLFPFIEVDGIVSNYRLWDLLLKRKRAAPQIDVNFSARDRAFSGFLRLEGAIDDAAFKGYIKYPEDERLDFTGRIRGGTLTANIKLNHFKLRGHDITCDAVLKNNFIAEPSGSPAALIEGELETVNLALNNRPLSNLKSSYRISDGALEISDLDIGNGFKIYGRVILKKPYDIDITLTADNTNMARALSGFNAQDSIAISGTVNGKFWFKGPIKNIKLDGQLDMRQGRLAGIDFEHLSASLKGDLPVIHIEDSRITRAGGSFSLGGEIDLSRAGRGNMFEGVKMVSSDTAIIWDGWDTMKMQDIQEVRMKKRMNEEVDLGFKKFVTDNRIDESLREADEYELKYSLNPNESLKLKLGQEQDFFGLEHKNKF